MLEESLSSQKLWKDTAGNRPPQPLEERAFFEQMWAQNFARSQVEYEMPVEVLTATTPISLSPFADGIFDGAHHHQPEMISHYNIGVPTSDMHSSGMGGGAGTDAVEATLVSRLNDPRGQHHVNAPLFAPGIMAGAEPYEIINRKVKGSTSAEDLTVLIKGDNVFGTTVSKSFARPGVNGGPIAGVDTVNISVACYRVVDVSCLARNRTDELLHTVPFVLVPFLISYFVYPFLFSVCLLRSPRGMANTRNSSSSIGKAAFATPLAFGNDTRTFKSFPGRLPKRTKGALPLLPT